MLDLGKKKKKGYGLPSFYRSETGKKNLINDNNSELQICCVQVTLLRGVSQKKSVNQSVSADKCCGEPVMQSYHVGALHFNMQTSN